MLMQVTFDEDKDGNGLSAVALTYSWVIQEVLCYIKENKDRMRDVLARSMTGVKT